MITFIGWDILRENPQILQVGDVFHQRSTSFISRNIRRFTQHPGERESFTSHTAMVLYSDTAPVLGHRYEPRPLRTGVMIIESQHRTNVNPILSYANDSTDAVITRVPGLTPADHAALQLAALEYEGRPTRTERSPCTHWTGSSTAAGTCCGGWRSRGVSTAQRSCRPSIRMRASTSHRSTVTTSTRTSCSTTR